VKILAIKRIEPINNIFSGVKCMVKTLGAIKIKNKKAPIVRGSDIT
jgi:hypothetical protein